MAGQYNQAGTVQRKSAYISWPAGFGPHSATTRGGDNAFMRKPARSEKSQPLWILLGQNSKEMLHWTVYNFVNTYFLSMPIFCRQLYFVNAYIYFVDTNILSMPIFCQCLYLVNAQIQRPYFVDANFLSMPIFCRR
jgi:hypothetical protein